MCFFFFNFKYCYFLTFNLALQNFINFSYLTFNHFQFKLINLKQPFLIIILNPHFFNELEPNHLNFKYALVRHYSNIIIN